MKNSRVFQWIVLVTVMTFAGAALAATAAAQSGHGGVVCSGLPCTVGLTMDLRGNLYTADAKTGYVFCIPPVSDPVLLARVPGIPTALAVDRQRNVFVTTEGGTVYLVALDGSVTATHRCDSRPVGITVDRDGGLVIATEEGMIVKVRRERFAER